MKKKYLHAKCVVRRVLAYKNMTALLHWSFRHIKSFRWHLARKLSENLTLASTAYTPPNLIMGRFESEGKNIADKRNKSIRPWSCQPCGNVNLLSKKCPSCGNRRPVAITSISSSSIIERNSVPNKAKKAFPCKRSNKDLSSRKKTEKVFFKDVLAESVSSGDFTPVLHECEMRLQDKNIKKSVLTNIIRTYGKSGLTSEVPKLLDRMRADLRIKPDIVHYSTALATFIPTGDYDNAIEVYNKMLNDKSHMNRTIYTSLITVCNRARKYQEAIQFVEKCRQFEHSYINYPALPNNMIDLVSTEVSSNSGASNINYDPYSSLPNDSLITSGQEIISYAGDKTTVKRLDTGFYNAAITAYGRAGNIKQALELYEEMDEHAIPRDKATYNAMLLAFAETKRGVGGERVQALVRQMKIDKIKFNAILYTSVMRALIQSGDWRSALAACDEMLQDPFVSPDMGCFETAMLACSMGDGQDARILALFDEMAKRNLPLSKSVLKSMVRGCGSVARESRPQLMQRVYREAISFGLIPSVHAPLLKSKWSAEERLDSNIPGDLETQPPSALLPRGAGMSTSPTRKQVKLDLRLYRSNRAAIYSAIWYTLMQYLDGAAGVLDADVAVRGNPSDVMLILGRANGEDDNVTALLEGIQSFLANDFQPRNVLRVRTVTRPFQAPVHFIPYGAVMQWVAARGRDTKPSSSTIVTSAHNDITVEGVVACSS